MPFIQQLNLCIDREKLLLYQVSYNDIYQTLKTAFKENQIATLRSYQQYLPIILGGKEKTIQEILDSELIEISKNTDGTRNKLSLSNFVTITPAQDLKTIVAGKSGEYIPMNFYHTDKAEKIISAAQKATQMIYGKSIFPEVFLKSENDRRNHVNSFNIGSSNVFYTSSAIRKFLTTVDRIIRSSYRYSCGYRPTLYFRTFLKSNVRHWISGYIGNYHKRLYIETRCYEPIAKRRNASYGGYS